MCGNGNCSNIDGSYRCTCPRGYTQGRYSPRCVGKSNVQAFFYVLYCKALLHLFSLQKNLNLRLSLLAFASNFPNELERFEDSFLLWISLMDTRNLINSPQPRNLMRKFQILVLFSFSHNSFRRTSINTRIFNNESMNSNAELAYTNLEPMQPEEMYFADP